VIGGGRWGHFPGNIANVRVYNKALTLLEIQQVMDDDQLALPAYRKGHPIDFSLFDEDQNYVLYVSDDPEEKHILNKKGPQLTSFTSAEFALQMI
jgi:hypothetical protein